MDNSPAALRLWNFLLSEEDRLRRRVAEGKKLVGTMKDLGTVPVMAYSLDNLVAFYPDGAWWLPCVMEGGGRSAGDRRLAGHRRFVLPGPGDARRVCRPGPFSHSRPADVQRRGHLRRLLGDRPASGIAGFSDPLVGNAPSPPSRPDEAAVELPGGFRRRPSQVAFVRSEFERVRQALGNLCRAAARRRATFGRHRPGQPGASASGRAAATGLHRRSVPAAGPGNADRRDAGDPFLLRS